MAFSPVYGQTLREVDCLEATENNPSKKGTWDNYVMQ
jgi:hypothetical protein